MLLTAFIDPSFPSLASWLRRLYIALMPMLHVLSASMNNRIRTAKSPAPHVHQPPSSQLDSVLKGVISSSVDPPPVIRAAPNQCFALNRSMHFLEFA